LQGVVHELARDVERDPFAVEVREHVARRLAGAKPSDARRLLESLVGPVDFGLHALGGNLDLELHEHGRKLLDVDLHGQGNVHAP
jgi:hypothetical protein